MIAMDWIMILLVLQTIQLLCFVEGPDKTTSNHWTELNQRDEFLRKLGGKKD